MALPLGSMLRGYRLDEVLGQGGFGITYKATDLRSQTALAIKEFMPLQLAARNATRLTVHPGSDFDTYLWGLERFCQEAELLMELQHFNIVRVRRIFHENRTAYLVMDYEEGEPLDVLLKSNPVPPPEDELMGFLLPLLDALELLHGRGTLHRDIKPGNLFIRLDGSPLLLDFGSARQATLEQQGQQQLTSLVSNGYSPVEQYGSAGPQGPWTDLYALAATLYRMITGKTPLTAIDRSVAALTRQPDPLVPLTRMTDLARPYRPEFLAAIDAALSHAPDQRPQTVAAFRTLLVGPAHDPERLHAGQKVALEQRTPDLSRIRVGLGWDAGDGPDGSKAFDLDASALLLDAEGRALSEAHVIFYNQLVSPCGAVKHLGDAAAGSGSDDDEQIVIDLDHVEPDVHRILFVISIHEGTSDDVGLEAVTGARIRLLPADGGDVLYHYSLTGVTAGHRGVTIGSIYRHPHEPNEWIFSAESRSYPGGLADVAREAGLEVG
ncbi:MAG: TerD family protein [Myxococcales bacterium]|nr:TerD family protein [Myxococcales bacterium]